MAGNKMSGSCLCGALRYETTATALFQGFCQCSDCHKVGSGKEAAIGVPADAVKISGKYTTYTKRGDSGRSIHRHFCPTCGGVVFVKGDAFPGVAIVNGALLDDPSMFKPDHVIFARSALHWDYVDPKLMKFEAMPPQA